MMGEKAVGSYENGRWNVRRWYSRRGSVYFVQHYYGYVTVLYSKFMGRSVCM